MQVQHREKQDESGQPSRPLLPQRLIVVPDPPNANRPLPPTPRSNNSSSSQSQNSQQPQRNAPMVSKFIFEPNNEKKKNYRSIHTQNTSNCKIEFIFIANDLIFVRLFIEIV